MKLKFALLLLPVLICIMPGTVPAAQKAPNFALVDNKGQFVFKSKMKGNILISFWASYCVPCKKEIPELIKFMDRYGKTKNLQLVLINVDDNSGTAAQQKAEDTLKSIGVSWSYLLDSYQKTLKNYNPKLNVPSTYLVNSDGYIVFQEVGAHKDTLERLEKAIESLR